MTLHADAQEHAPRKRMSRRRACCLGCVVLLVVPLAGLLIPWAVARNRLEAKLEAKLAELRATGMLVDPIDLAPPPVEPEDDAGPLYLRAAAVIEASGTTVYGEQNWAEPGAQAIAREQIAWDSAAFELLTDASHRPYARFPVDWAAGAGAFFLHYTKLRNLARVQSAASAVEAGGGDQEAALEHLRQGFVISRHTAQEPLLITQTAVYAIDAIMVRAGEYVLAQGDLPEPAARRLAAELAREDQFDLIPGARAQLAQSVDLYEQARRDPSGGLFLSHVSADPWWWKPLVAIRFRCSIDADELICLGLSEKFSAASAKPWRDAISDWKRLAEAAEQTPDWARGSRMLMSNNDRDAQKREISISRRRVMRTALGLMVYQQRFGEYPEKLGALERIKWDVPEDISSGKPLIYHRKGDRFVLYGIGPDLKDDGGAPLPYEDKKRSPGTVKMGPLEVQGGDVLWWWWDEREKARRSL